MFASFFAIPVAIGVCILIAMYFGMDWFAAHWAICFLIFGCVALYFWLLSKLKQRLVIASAVVLGVLLGSLFIAYDVIDIESDDYKYRYTTVSVYQITASYTQYDDSVDSAPLKRYSFSPGEYVATYKLKDSDTYTDSATVFAGDTGEAFLTMHVCLSIPDGSWELIEKYSYTSFSDKGFFLQLPEDVLEEAAKKTEKLEASAQDAVTDGQDSPPISGEPGWYQTERGYYYYETSGNLRTNQWVLQNDCWFYFDDTGLLQNNTVTKIDGNLYGFDETSAMVIGFHQFGDYWYFFNQDGIAYTAEWIEYGGNWYYFEASGRMLTNATMSKDGKTYWFDENGHASEIDNYGVS